MKKKKVILNVATTLDGFIAGPNGEYDWCFTDSDYGMTGFLAEVDTIIMGRKSYEVVLPFGHPYPDHAVKVFSGTLRDVPFPNVEVVSGDAVEYTRAATAAAGKSIWLFGGAQITGALLNAGLIDELHLSVHPIALGSGIPLFPADARQRLSLARNTCYASGLVQSVYQVKPG